nr:hypothetical protein CFP56_17440 [Quercus suber]
MFHLPQHSNQELDQERCFTSGCNSGAMRACGNWRRNGGDGGDRALTPKIILSQEKNIQKLNEIVQSLREELLHCRGGSEVVNSTATHLTELLTELERHPILED